MRILSTSASRLQTAEACWFKYWLTYVAKMRDQMKSNWGAEHGSLIHDILEMYVKGIDRDWRTRLYTGYRGLLETQNKWGKKFTMPSPLRVAKPRDYANKPTPCDGCPYKDVEHNRCGISHEPLDALPGCPKSLFEFSVKMLEDAFARYDEIYEGTGEAKVLDAEYEVNMGIRGTEIPLICLFDLVVQLDEDTVWIIDYKTGVTTKNFEELREEIQAKAYFYAGYREFIEDASGKGHKFKNLLLSFDYFQKDPVMVSFTEDERADIERELCDRSEEVKARTTVTRVTGNRAPNPENRGDWKCRYLCDIDVCTREWDKLVEQGRVQNHSFEETSD